MKNIFPPLAYLCGCKCSRAGPRNFPRVMSSVGPRNFPRVMSSVGRAGLVRTAGLEPARDFSQEILSPSCLRIRHSIKPNECPLRAT